ncbi:sigma-70 family RNA polymerase sigma factor [Paludisphaera sp.]|uniref:RNA polymerase sigma factor n=1 Tax=Paludisphaera sp. TaxID=2017432 RepID=UPI00301D1909
MSRSGRGVGREVGRLLRDGVDPPGGDARLLRRFLADRDPAAFEAIVDRHGPPVMAVCRRYLRDPADAEDAFQATFLVLVRKAGGLRDADALSSWLYGVAYRVAVRARSNALKRRAREGEREGLRDAPAEPSRPVDDALEAMDAELARLPEKYRAPLVLCYLRGRTHDQAAAELGWPVGTVRSRMAKGRSILRDRLSRRGVEAPACLAALRAEVAAIPSVPSSLVAATASAAVRFAGLPAGLAWLGASPSSSTWPAARLALGVSATMFTMPWKALGIALACAGVTAAALAAGSVEAPGGPQDPPKAEPPPVAEKPAAPEAPPAGDVEGRLSEVERKLDRLIGLMESPPARALAPAPSPNAGAPPELTPAAPPAVEARTLREIEAQLVGLERKYRIVDRYLGDRNDLIPRLQAENLREDAIAPARVLVARLREMEDEGRSELAKVQDQYGFPAGTLDDPDRALAAINDLFEKAEERFQRAREALKRAGIEEVNVPPFGPPKGVKDEEGIEAMEEYQQSSLRFQSLGRALGRMAQPAWMTDQERGRVPDAPPVTDKLKPTYRKLAEVRRLIAWAKERFPDVELTTDDAPVQEGETAD